MSRQNIMDSKSIWGYTRAYTRTPLQHKPLNLLRCINPLPILKQKANKRTKTHKQKPFSDAASVSHKDFLVLQQGMERSGVNQIFVFFMRVALEVIFILPIQCCDALWYQCVGCDFTRTACTYTNAYTNAHRTKFSSNIVQKKDNVRYDDACVCIYVRLYVSHPTPLTPHPSYFDTHGVTRSFGARTHTHAVLFAALKIHQNNRITGMGSCPLFFCKIGQCVFYLAHTTNQQAKAPLR